MNTKVLVSLAVIGLATAAAGGSTLALFSDQESSTGNAFATGAVDLKIDWEETYNNDSVENQTATDNPGPVFNFNDIKPGDYGEATISLDLQTNPAWVWFRLTTENDTEVGCTEPEGEAENGSCGENGELDENFNTTLWYDDGDNVFEPGDGEERIETSSGQTCKPGDSGGLIDVALVIDESGSMTGSKIDAAKNGSKQLVNSLKTQDQSALVSFTTTAEFEQNLTTNKTKVKNEIENLTAGGGTDIATGVRAAHTELINGSNARSNATKIMVVLSDGQGGNPLPAANASKDDNIRIITIALGSGADKDLLRKMATSDDDAYVSPSASDLQGVFGNISGSICTPTGLSDGILLDGNHTTDSKDPYPAGTSYIGFKWNVPRDTGNEVQMDSLVYDMDFHTVQSRHNNETTNPWAE